MKPYYLHRVPLELTDKLHYYLKFLLKPNNLGLGTTLLRDTKCDVTNSLSLGERATVPEAALEKQSELRGVLFLWNLTGMITIELTTKFTISRSGT